MNVGDVATRVRRVFGDESSVQIIDQDIFRWVNDAQERIVLENTGLLEATGTADVVVNQKQYDLPTDLSVLRSLAYRGFHLQALNFNDFNAYVNGYQAPPSLNPYGVGTPELYTSWQGQIWLYPVPQENVTGGLNIYYIKHPTTVSTLADNLTVPIQYHTAVADYVLAQAYELDENYDARKMKQGEFAEQITKLNDRNKWINQETYPTITVLPEDQSYGDYSFFLG